MGEVGFGTAAGVMELGKHDLLVGAMLGTPERDMALEGADLAGLITVRMFATQGRKQRVGLQGVVTFELGLHPGPVGRKRVGAGAIRAGLLELAGEGAPLLIRTGSIGMHAGTGGSLFLGFSLAAFTEHDLHLGIRLHRGPP